MTIKEINKSFSIYKDGDLYRLHSNEITEYTGSRSKRPFLCFVVKKSSKFKVNSESFEFTNDLEELKHQVNEYVKSLEYPSGYYDPTYRNGIFEEFVIHDYLESIGFKYETHSFGHESYVLNDKSIYGGDVERAHITFKGLDSFSINGSVPEEVCISLSTGRYSCVTCTCKRTINEIKESINALLKPLLLTESVKNLQISDKIETINDVDLIMNKLSGFTVQKEYIREDLKKKLIELAEKM